MSISKRHTHPVLYAPMHDSVPNNANTNTIQNSSTLVGFPKPPQIPSMTPTRSYLIPTHHTSHTIQPALVQQQDVTQPVVNEKDMKKDTKKDKKSKKDEMIEIDLSQIQDKELREMFSGIYDKIEEKQKDIKGLHNLKARYVSDGKNSFDMEDLQDVEVELKKQETILLELENKLRTRVLCFNSNIMKLHQILLERQRLLDEAETDTGVLTRNPRLLNKIVDKQVRLEGILSETKAKLMEGIDDDNEENSEDEILENLGIRKTNSVYGVNNTKKKKEWWEEDSVIDDCENNDNEKRQHESKHRSISRRLSRSMYRSRSKSKSYRRSRSRSRSKSRSRRHSRSRSQL